MIEFLVDNIFVVFGGKVFKQIVGIPMGTNCAPLLADIFLYSYEAEFIQSLLSTGKKVRLGYCLTPYQRLWLYNGAPLVAFYDTLGIRRTYSRLKPPASPRGSTGKKKIASQFNFTYRYIDDVLSINQSITQIFIWVRCIPLSLRSKTRRRAIPLLPT